MRTPNYITTKEVIIDNGPQDKQVLPAGASVRPVLEQYLPAHIKERFKEAPVDKYICYCRFGFVPIWKDWIREV